MNQREIAKKLNVSQAAVSLVLRDPLTTRVSAEKRKKIAAALRENGFFNSTGVKRTWAVGFIADPLQNRADAFIQNAVCGAEEELCRSCYSIIFECFRNRELIVFKNRQVDGLIIRSGPALEALLGSGHALPMVLLNCAAPGVVLDTVMPDNRGGILAACGKFASAGCRRIAFLGAEPEYSPYSCNYSERVGAYLEFCRRSGQAPLLESLALPVGDSPAHRERIAAIIAGWRQSPVPPDAVIAVNHPYAVLAQEAAPELPVAAGDNKKFPGLEAPVRFVLEQDPRAMGAFAAELLLKRIADPGRSHVRLDCGITLRGF